jgi:hypothetical protein
MTKRKAAKKPAAAPKTKSERAEPTVIVLAEKLGTFLGRATKKADAVLANPTVRQRAGQIRDGATALVKQVNRAGAVVAKTVAKAKPAAKKTSKAQPAKTTKGRSGGVVDAPGKRHRKPPPQEPINKRLGEVTGKKAGQKQFKVGKSRGRG